MGCSSAIYIESNVRSNRSRLAINFVLSNITDKFHLFLIYFLFCKPISMHLKGKSQEIIVKIVPTDASVFVSVAVCRVGAGVHAIIPDPIITTKLSAIGKLFLKS